ncbi:hypothetical protein NHX12_032360 [Muraenolepis orangiensis]|uniref:Interleukin-10 n=1 Tax=Muraenolepis orangiensis TaxID=630683 RepID=A0A9Q0ILG1_9TELE|nr:hypothetical protein NHX12_032360 [Muraenolepis orangiensis]
MWPIFVSLVVLSWTGLSQSTRECSCNSRFLGYMNTEIIHRLKSMECALERIREEFIVAFLQLKTFLEKQKGTKLNC